MWYFQLRQADRAVSYTHLDVYKRQDLRYRHTTENGELWSKSTLYRVLLGYYEATGEQRVKDALVRAFDNLMEGYPMGSSDPFLVDKSFCEMCIRDRGASTAPLKG